jgi:uncharacterized protein (DUF697 family)
VAERLIESTARRAGAAGALVFLPGADMPVITLMQIRLVAELAALHDRPLGVDRAPELGAVFLAGFGWRALGRQLAGAVPGAGWALKGGLAYTATRAIGEAARAWFAEGGERADRPLAGLRSAIETAIRRRRG